MRKFFIFLFFLSLSIINYQLSISSAYAAEEFLTRFTSTYDISAEGVARVTHYVELTNRLSEVSASEYALTIGSTRIKDVTAHSPAGVQTSITTGENSTIINLKFDTPIVGKNQTHRFEISYTNLDIATKSGRVLEVNIPKMGNSNEIEDYAVVVKVPASFDAPSLMAPVTKSITQSSGQQILRYGKNQLSGKGISILFGDHQVYDFTLRYTLENPSLSQVTTTIAIPPDTSYQKMYYHSLEPQPTNVVVDEDGNWLAKYSLAPKQTQEVRATGLAVLYLKSTLPLDVGDTTKYLQSATYWPTTDAQIRELAMQLKTPENIYNYVASNLSYNYQRIDAAATRLGAKAALENPQNAICTEFTDLFVALSRAAGIPARSQDGFAFTQNSKLRPLSLKLDILHAWPEYFDQGENRWVPVDPTWGNTTGGIDYFSRWDLNHFTFTIHGSDSVKPFPAGAYKIKAESGKDVNVAFSNQEPTPIDDLDIQPTSATVVITNRGNQAAYQVPVSYNDQIVYTIPVLPPFATYTYETPAAIRSSIISVSLAVGVVAGAAAGFAYLARRIHLRRTR